MADTRRSGRFITPPAALAAAVALGVSILVAVHVAGGDPEPPQAQLPPYARSPPPSGGVLRGTRPVPTPSAPGPIGVATGPRELRYTFDGGVGQPITAVGGGYRLHPLGQNDGALTLVPKGPGLAVGYPRRCTLAADSACPRAILEGERDDSLNPGRRTLSYGASILMTPEDKADGANVLQKGFSVGNASQFKLQVDHEQGHPSCVVVGHAARIYRAEPTLDVADGRWHTLACHRSGGLLSISVDGVRRASVPVPATLSIANAEPLRVGGKGPAMGNDQYAGLIDDVFVTIG